MKRTIYIKMHLHPMHPYLYLPGLLTGPHRWTAFAWLTRTWKDDESFVEYRTCLLESHPSLVCEPSCLNPEAVRVQIQRFSVCNYRPKVDKINI